MLTFFDDTEGYVLAGGAGRRMGVDKARVMLGGVGLAERAARILDAVCRRVTIVGAHIDGRESIDDRVGEGHAPASIYGLHAALSDCRSKWAAVLACDLPFVNAGVFRLLRERAVSATTAVLPVQPDGRIQPLAAIYRPSLCLVAVEAAISRGDLKLASALDGLNAVRVSVAGGSTFLNINTPSDLLHAEKLSMKDLDPPRR